MNRFVVPVLSDDVLLDCFTSDVPVIRQLFIDAKNATKRKAAEVKKVKNSQLLAEQYAARIVEQSKRAKQLAKLVAIAPQLVDSGISLTGLLGEPIVPPIHRGERESGLRRLAAKMAEVENSIGKRRLSE